MQISRLLLAICSLGLLACANLAHAQSSTETYTYDALGRLVKVETQSGSNDGIVSDITYDDAGNRVSYDTTGVSTSPPPPPPPPGSAEDALEADFVGRTNSGMWDFRTATNGGSFSVANIAGGLSAFTGTGGTVLESVSAVTGAKFANNDRVEAPASGNFVLYFLMRKDPDNDAGFIVDEPWPDRVRYWDGSNGSVGNEVRFYENGSFSVPYSGLDAFHDALDDDEFHVFKTGSWLVDDALKLGRLSNGMEVDVIAVVALDLDEVADLQTTEALIANWFEEISPGGV